MPAMRVEAKDERTITVPVPAEQSIFKQFAAALILAADDGYCLSSATTIRGGNQRDETTTGLRVVLSRTPS